LSADNPLRVLLVLPTLGLGGVESLAACVSRRARRENVLARITTLYDQVPLLEQAGVPVDVGPGGRWAILSRLVHLRRSLRDFRPQVVVSFMDQTGPYVLAARRMASRDFVWIHSLHGTDIGPRSLRRRILVQVCRRISIWKSRRTFCCSRHRAEEVRRQFPAMAHKIVPLHNAADFEAFSNLPGRKTCRKALGVATDGHVIVCVARLIQAEKGQDLLIRAMPEILRAHPDTELYLVGPGPDREVFERLIEESALGASVFLTGPSTRVPEWMGAADVVVQPSRDEPFGLVLAEAGAAGRPAVATNVDGIPEVVVDQKTGILVEPESPHALAEAITDLLSSPERRQHLGEAARQHVLDNFTPRAWWSQLKNLLE